MSDRRLVRDVAAEAFRDPKIRYYVASTRLFDKHYRDGVLWARGDTRQGGVTLGGLYELMSRVHWTEMIHFHVWARDEDGKPTLDPSKSADLRTYYR